MSSAGGKPAPSRRAARVKGPNRGQAKTKIVVRRLPANLPEHVFMDSITTLAPEHSLDRAITWVPGKVSKNPVKGNTFARAYIYFKNERQAHEFQKTYHGHLFKDRNGNEGRAHVEFAPFQKVPREQRKPDAKQGTIEEDPEYIAFLESMNAEPTEAEREMKLPETEQLLKESAINPKSTPLLEALRAQKAAAQAKAQAAKLAARQARQAGKAGISNASKAQITILANRNAKDNANNRSHSSGVSAAAASRSQQNQQNQQGQQQGQQGKKNTQASGAETKPKRERKRRDRASKRAGAEGSASGNTGNQGDSSPQITLLKPNRPATAPVQPDSSATSTVPHGNPGGANPGQRRGQPNQNNQQQHQQQQSGGANAGNNEKKDAAQQPGADGASGRSGRSRRNRGDRSKQELKAAGNTAPVSNNSNKSTGNKALDNQSGGPSGRPGRTRRNRGGGGGGGAQENSAGPAVQG